MDKNGRAFALYTTMFMVALLLALSFMNIMATGATFNYQRTLTNDTVEQERLKMAVVGSGSTAHVYLVYEDRTTVGINSPHVFFRRSTNGGSTFDTPVDFLSDWSNTQQKQVFPSIAVHEGTTTNTIAVVYLDNSDDAVFLDYIVKCMISTDGGSTWSGPYDVNPNPQNNYKETTATFDPNGNLFVLYFRGSIYYVSFSTDFGQTWSSAVEVPLPESTNTGNYYKLGSIAADGSYVGIAYLSEPDWKVRPFFVRAPTTNLGSGSLTWDSNIQLMNYMYGATPQGWNPVLTAEKDVFHLTWWDFSTDPGMGYEQKTTDRPSIKYTRSTDHGNSFKVGSQTNIIVNESVTPSYWISPPWMDTSPSGKIAIMWVDYSRGQPNLFVTVSSDNGATWSKPNRINSYFPDHDFSSTLLNANPDVMFKVGMDRGDNLYAAWLARTTTIEDKEIMFANSVVNVPPVAITDLKVIGYEEFNGEVSWSINREPDFMEYRTHISTTQGFTPNYVPFPAGTLYNVSKKQSMNYESFKDLEADAIYYVKVEVADEENVTSVSNEVSFKTLPINVGPIFNKELENLVIEMEEDSKLVKAINLTDWVDYSPYTYETRYDFAPGKYIKDDWYNNIYDLYFELECEDEEPIVLGNLYDEWHGETYYYIDFNANPNFKDLSGDVRFRLKVSDPGKDGSLLTIKDNKVNTSFWFTVSVLSTNDLPTWESFTDLMIGTGKVTDMSRITDILVLDDANTSCIEEQEYNFKIVCDDVDPDDFIRLNVQTGDPMKSRVGVKRDNVNPRRAAIFTFTPQDTDLPEVRMNLTADDEMGGIINVTLVIPVKNLNDEPYFLTVSGEPVEPKGSTVTFEAEEHTTLTFNVTGGDIDPNELLTLTGSPSTVKVQKTGFGSWDVSFKVPAATTTATSTTLGLVLRDRQGSFAEMTVTLKIINVQERPQWTLSGQPVVLRPVYDETDMNEWKKPGGDYIRPEYGETVEFEGFATDPDLDILNYTWRFSNLKGNINWTVFGKKVLFSFYPTESTLWAPKREKFGINLTVSDKFTEPIYTYIETWVDPDDDNDNDGIPDSREKWFHNLVVDPEKGRPEKTPAWMGIKDDTKWREFADRVVQNYKDAQPLLTAEVQENPLLLIKPDEDLDRDRTEDNYRYTNKEEIGFDVPEQETEKERVPRIITDSMDPFDPLVWPGRPRVAPYPDKDSSGEDDVPLWVIIAASIIAIILILAVVTVIFILRREKSIEKKEEADIEKRVKDHEKRQAVIQGLYGVQKAGDAIGPDQSTLSDLTLDLGGQVYHEEGSHGLISKKQEEAKGPQRQKSDSGPLFEKSAPKLDLGESLKLETIDISDDVTQLDHSGVDEEALDSSMDDLMEAAEEYDPNAVRNAGGNVMVGALPMEEQMKLRQQGAQVGGPRLPPPGQEGVPMAPPPRPPMPGAPPLPQQMPPKRPPQ